MADNEQRLARVCWNEQNWQRPTGLRGKSQSADTYEKKNGYGHEEWLLDGSKIYKGYHYGFLQPINHGLQSYIGKTFDIHIYTINPAKQMIYLGYINNVKVVDREERQEVYSYYQEKGWIDGMKAEVMAVGGEPKDLDKDWIFNIKFKMSDAHIDLKKAKEINNIKNRRYTTLLKFSLEYKFQKDKSGNFKYLNVDSYEKNNKAGKTIVDQKHKKIQNAIYDILKNDYAYMNLEKKTDYSSDRIDIIGKVKSKKEQWHFFEVKTQPTALLCIREALGQILEYNHFPATTHASKMFIVGPEEPSANDIAYLDFLRSHYQMPVWYRWYNFNNGKLSKPY